MSSKLSCLWNKSYSIGFYPIDLHLISILFCTTENMALNLAVRLQNLHSNNEFWRSDFMVQKYHQFYCFLRKILRFQGKRRVLWRLAKLISVYFGAIYILRMNKMNPSKLCIHQWNIQDHDVDCLPSHACLKSKLYLRNQQTYT